ncbi:Ger(x)C family spore germination protein [Paenibacillus humicola]|uniref:Ger(x)C family spore germination protein n=1 Tax=Paenibacillus humicola TaxID=3110540 RepID=UPI00237B14F1|nr:Ger(x)C family spore germination protein [Paenibacillus humicola]
MRRLNRSSRAARLLKLICIVSMTAPLLTGCWDRLEIDERGVVLGIGIDVAPPKEKREESLVTTLDPKQPRTNKPLVRITVQIAVPGRIPLGPGEGGGGGNAGAAKTVWIIDVVGRTIDDAVSNLQQQISAPLFFGHLRIIVVSEEYARSGLQNINDYFHRNSEIRRTTWMVISKGKAKAIMQASPELERVPSLYLQSSMDQAVRMGKLPNVFLGVFWSAVSKKGQEAYLPYVVMKKKNNIQIAGLAYFREDRIVGTTKPLEIAILMAIKNMNPAGYQTFAPIRGMGAAVYTATHRKSKIEAELRNGIPHFKIHVEIEGNIREKTDEGFTIDPNTIAKIQRDIESFNEKSSNELIKMTQKEGADIFGFGEYIRAYKWGYWNSRVKTKEKWQEIYKDITFEVDTRVHVRRVGMKAV